MNTSRREFLKITSSVLAGAIAAPAFALGNKLPPLSFSTLGCPDWTLTQIADFAAQHGFKGIEVRGILRQMDLSKVKEFNKENTTATLRLLHDKGLSLVNLGSSATLHFADPTERKKNLDDGKRYIDLAQQLKCPYIRVFPNNFPKDQEKKQTMDLIAQGLLELGNHANGSTVNVLLETHGDLVHIEDLQKVMNDAEHKHVGLIWDISNMWTITKESPTLAYTSLKKYIQHTHIKDALLTDGKITYTRLGQGDVPIFEAINTLSKGGYKGYYSFEWEKMWHPEIEAPELAFADYAEKMKKHFQG